jgi:VWFA-related protein
MRGWWLGALVAVSVTIGAVASGQAPQQGDQPVFRSGVDLVRLDVRITDAGGRPIKDIRPSEVSVVDGGVERPVLLFEHVAESGRSYLESTERTVAGDISTNRGAPQGQLYVLIFDQDHITPGREQRVRRAAETFLRERVRPYDRVAIYGVPAPGPVQPFTADVSRAIAELQSVRGSLDRNPTGGPLEMRVNEAYEILRGNEQVLTRFLTSTNGRMDRTGVLPDASTTRLQADAETVRRLAWEHARTIVAGADAASQRFLDYTANILRTFRGIDGRKTVLLFSEGFYADNVGRELKEVARAAAETYSVVYAFDLNDRIDNLSAATSVGTDQSAEAASRLDPLSALAADTDGRLVLNANGALETELNTLATGEVDYYIVGFQPSPDSLNEAREYRPVNIRVSRPDARVNMRSGYSAGPRARLGDRRRAIDTAMAAPFSQHGLSLEYTTYVSRSEEPGLASVAVSLKTELPVREHPSDAADVVFIVRNAETGQVAASGSDRVALPEAPQPGSTMGGGTWRVRFDLPADRYLMRCVVREPGGLIGSADRRFTVPDLSGRDVSSSDLLLGVAGDALPVRTEAYSGETLAGAVRVFGTPGRLAGVTGQLELINLAGDGRPSRTIAADPAAIEGADAGATRDLRFTIPVSGLDAGDYVARAVIRSGGEVVSDVRRQLRVIDGPPPARPSDLRPATTPEAPEPREVVNGVAARRLIDAAAHVESPTIRLAAGNALTGRWTDVPKALESIPADNVDAAHLRALARLDARDYAGAAEDLNRQLEADPGNAAVAFLLGWARAGAGNDVGAASAFRTAAWLEPSLVPAHLALADTYLRLGQRALAVQAIEAGLRGLPDSPELKQKLAALKR